MTVNELLEFYYYYNDELKTPELKEWEEVDNILYDRFFESDNDFFNKCENLINTAVSDGLSGGFMLGFKHGFEFANSLGSFFNRRDVCHK